MMKNMRRGIPSLFQSGTTHLSGVEEAIIRNCQGCKQLTEITRTSLGPHGMNKMIINYLDKMFVTSDTATIMNEMEIDHPAAKMIVMASQMQEQEVGDGSNFVVCFTGELLAKAEQLLRMGLHPSEVLDGYEKASEFALEQLEQLACAHFKPTDMTDAKQLTKAVSAAIGAKQFGNVELLSRLVTEACVQVMPANVRNFNVENVRVARVLGGEISQSEVVPGVVTNRDTEGSIKDVKNAVIAVYTCGIQSSATETKSNVVLTSADQLLNYANAEEKDIETTIKEIADTGVNVIVTGSGIDDMAAHFLEKFKICAVRIGSKFEIRRLAASVNAKLMVTLETPTKDQIGHCERVYVRDIGAAKVTCFVSGETSDVGKLSTIVLRSSTMNLLTDLSRATDDGVNTVKAMAKDGRFVAGGGGIDIALASQLKQFAAKQEGLAQYPINKFAEAFEVVPRTLAENAGLKALDAIANLYEAYAKGDGKGYGLDIKTGQAIDVSALETPIIEPMLSKLMGIKLATDCALTILRVDKVISAKRAGGSQAQKGGGAWDGQN